MNVLCTRIRTSVNFPVMKMSVSDLRSGNLVEFRGTIWRVVRKRVVEKTRGESLQIQMRGILDTDAGFDERFRSKDKLEKVHTEQRSVRFKYPWEADNGYFYVFHDADKGGDWNLPAEFVGGWQFDAKGEKLWYGEQGQADFFDHDHVNPWVMMNFYNGEPVGVEHPESVVLRVTGTLKKEIEAYEDPIHLAEELAKLKENKVQLLSGYWLSVPPSVDVGDKIRVNTDTGEYVESVKN